MQNLEEALAFSNYQITLTRQKTLLRQTFENDCLLGYSGGLFLVTPEFISGLDSLNKISRYVIDHNNNPIWVEEIADLKIKSINCYNDAVTKYGTAYSQLKTQRSVKSLAGL